MLLGDRGGVRSTTGVRVFCGGGRPETAEVGATARFPLLSFPKEDLEAVFSRLRLFLGAVASVGTVEAPHSPFPPGDSPEIETNVVPVWVSNTSRLARSAHTVAVSGPSSTLTIARTSPTGCDADTDADCPDFNCTFITSPMPAPSASKKLTSTGQRSETLSRTITLDTMARAPWLLVNDTAAKRMASSRREDAKSMAWATPEPPIVSANDVNKIVFIFSPPFAGNVRA